MIPVNKWPKIKEIIQKNINGNGAICILFLNPNNASQAQQQIVRNIEYLNARSGRFIDFLIPGFDYDDNLFLTDFINRFDVQGFVEFINEFERESRWRYGAGTQLVILPYINWEFNYSKVIDINLDKVRLYGNNEIIDVFFEKLISKFRYTNPDYFEMFSDIKHRYALSAIGWDIILDFIKKDIVSFVKRFSYANEILKLFKPKDLRNIPSKKTN